MGLLCVAELEEEGRVPSVKVIHCLIIDISRLLATREAPSPFSNQSTGCAKGQLQLYTLKLTVTN